jgi:TOBE domain-containing protein
MFLFSAVHAEPPDRVANMFAGRVESVVYFDARNELAVVLALGGRLIAHTANDRVEPTGRHEIGRKVHLSWPADYALVVSGQ